jgi:hypothetical protein
VKRKKEYAGWVMTYTVSAFPDALDLIKLVLQEEVPNVKWVNRSRHVIIDSKTDNQQTHTREKRKRNQRKD